MRKGDGFFLAASADGQLPSRLLLSDKNTHHHFFTHNKIYTYPSCPCSPFSPCSASSAHRRPQRDAHARVGRRRLPRRRWVLISTDVRPLIARPDSTLTRATRYALRATRFARSPGDDGRLSALWRPVPSPRAVLPVEVPCRHVLHGVRVRSERERLWRLQSVLEPRSHRAHREHAYGRRSLLVQPGRHASGRRRPEEARRTDGLERRGKRRGEPRQRNVLHDWR